MPLPHASHRSLITVRRSLDQAAEAIKCAIDAFREQSTAYQSREENQADVEQLLDTAGWIQQARNELLDLCRKDIMPTVPD